MQSVFVKSVLRAASFLVLLAFFGFVVFLFLYFCHRVGEGDSYARSSGGATIEFGPTVSPANGTLVFSSFKTGRGDLYLSDEKGKAVWQLTRDEWCEGSPTFSPNGKQIVYIKETPQASTINAYKGEVWVMNADGTDARAVTHDETNYSDPVFSADGKSVYATRLTPSMKVSIAELFRVAVDGNSAPVLLPSRSWREPADIPKGDRWAQGGVSPDKKWMVFTSDPYSQSISVSRMDEGEGDARQIFQSKERNYLTGPEFSRDGKSIFFSETGMDGPIQISRVAFDGSGYTRIAATNR